MYEIKVECTSAYYFSESHRSLRYKRNRKIQLDLVSCWVLALFRDIIHLYIVVKFEFLYIFKKYKI